MICRGKKEFRWTIGRGSEAEICLPIVYPRECKNNFGSGLDGIGMNTQLVGRYSKTKTDCTCLLH